MKLIRRRPASALVSFALLGLWLLAVAASALASPRSDAWKLRRSDPEAALAALRQVVRDDPNDAKAFWFMTLILKDLNRPDEASQALQNARRADPSLGFTDNPAGIEKIERSLQKAGGAAQAGAALSGAPALNGTHSTQPGGGLAVPPPRLDGSAPGAARSSRSSASAMDAAQSLRGQGWKAHQAGDNERAVQLLGEALQADPGDAKAWWFLALVLEDLDRPAQALQALQNARRADPQLGFTDNPAGVERKERGLARKAGAGDAPPGAASGAPRTGGATPSTQNMALNQEVVRALQKSGVYVSPAMREMADPAQIASALRGVAPNGLQANIVVLASLPRGARTAGHLAQQAHGYLKPGDDGFVVVVAGREVGVYGAGLSKQRLQDIVQSSAKTFDSEGYAAGVAQIARLVAGEKARDDALGRNTLLALVGIPTALILWTRHRGKKRRAVHLAQTREAARALSSKLAPQLEKLDSDFEYALLSEDDQTRKTQLQEHRRRAGEAFSDAMRLLGEAQSADEFSRALAALQAAQSEMQRAGNVLQGRPADEGVPTSPSPVPPLAPMMMPPADAPANGSFNGSRPAGGADGTVEVPPLGDGLEGARPGYALDFFTSQPVPRDQMVPVDLEINGQKRRVWASRESAQSALAGEPQIATLHHEGQQRAWFDVPQYNPWHSFGAQMLQMMAINMLLNSMMGHNHAFGGGYAGYGGWGGGWFDGGYSGSHDDGYHGRNYHDSDSARRDDGYDSRMNDASHDAGVASLDAPFSGGDFSASPASSEAGNASLDIFGGSSGGLGGDSS